MEKLLILTEKRKAGELFATALGGYTGTYNGKDYVIHSLQGHILAYPMPETLAKQEYKETVGKFSKIDAIPWNFSYFDFTKKLPLNSYAKDSLIKIKSYINQGYTPVIACDLDPTGEGDLIGMEVLDFVNYKGKIYRSHHLGETPTEIQQAMNNLKTIDHNNKMYRMAYARQTMDWFSMQLTRVATVTLQQKGVKLTKPVSIGRLQSVIISYIGKQHDLIDAYVPSSYYESRYKLDNLILSSKDVEQYKTLDEWEKNANLPKQVNIREVKQTPGKTIPPKPLMFSMLCKKMSKLGMPTSVTEKKYQEMYEKGVLTYIRTEDDFISEEQYNEMLPHVDKLLNLLSLPTAAFTHRTPRPTHVKNGGAHGANRPGLNFPNSLEDLDKEFGKGASTIYKMVANYFLMMFLEDTEWVNHEYETVGTTPIFKGNVKIITKQGVTDPDSDEKYESKLPNINKKAELYGHEVKSKKPASPSEGWVLDQLIKDDVGTEATRVPTLNSLVGKDDTKPIKYGKILTLTPLGMLDYESAKETIIGSVEGTKLIHTLMKNVKNGGSFDDAYFEFRKIISKDADTIRNKTIDVSKFGIKQREYVEGTWNGVDVRFNKRYGSHEFTDDEIKKLLNDETIEITLMTKNGESKVVGKLQNLQTDDGKPFVGFKGEFAPRSGYVEGTWNGKNVKFKGSYGNYEFSPDEVQTLLDGGVILFDYFDDKTNTTKPIKGKLEIQEYNGKKYVGFKPQFEKRDDYAYGTWKGKEISFKRQFLDHIFNDDEVERLLKDEYVVVTATNKFGKKQTFGGKLQDRVYQGRKFIAYTPEFDTKKGKNDGVL